MPETRKALGLAARETVLMLANRKFAYAAIPLAALIAFSRLYPYVHFPSDVLLGCVTVFVGHRFLDRLEVKGAI